LLDDLRLLLIAWVLFWFVWPLNPVTTFVYSYLRLPRWLLVRLRLVGCVTVGLPTLPTPVTRPFDPSHVGFTFVVVPRLLVTLPTHVPVAGFAFTALAGSFDLVDSR